MHDAVSAYVVGYALPGERKPVCWPGLDELSVEMIDRPGNRLSQLCPSSSDILDRRRGHAVFFKVPEREPPPAGLKHFLSHRMCSALHACFNIFSREVASSLSCVVQFLDRILQRGAVFWGAYEKK